jgi:drug/metabolite transporter (DMT)-like permease
MTNESRHQGRNWCLAFVVNLMWAAQYPAYKVASDAMGIGATNFWTFVIATLCLVPFLIRERRKGRGTKSTGRNWMQLVLLGVLGLIPPSVILAWGIEHTSASNAAILSLTIPVMMVWMGVLFLKERPQRLFLVSLILALSGAAVISWGDIAAESLQRGMLVGTFAILVGSMGSAFYNAYGKKVLESYSELEMLVYGYVIAIVLCGPISLVMDPVPFYSVTHWHWRAWLAVLVLGLMSWGLAMVIWLWLLKRLEVAQISVSVYMLPALGVFLSAVTLGERLSLMQVGGALVILASAYFCSAQKPPAIEELQNDRA